VSVILPYPRATADPATAVEPLAPHLVATVSGAGVEDLSDAERASVLRAADDAAAAMISTIRFRREREIQAVVDGEVVGSASAWEEPVQVVPVPRAAWVNWTAVAAVAALEVGLVVLMIRLWPL
jgi:hypothetical protein